MSKKSQFGDNTKKTFKKNTTIVLNIHRFQILKEKPGKKIK